MRLKVGLLVVLVFCIEAVYAQEGLDTEITGNAYGSLRMLIQRASRQYTMYQYGVGDLSNTRGPLIETIDNFNAGLARVMTGEAVEGAPRVNDEAVMRRLGIIEEKWRRLEEIYTYQPYKLFLHEELLPVGERRKDPGLVQYVDRLTTDLLNEFSILIVEFRRYCDATGSPACSRLLLETGTLLLLTESVANDILFARLGIDVKNRRSQIREETAEFEAALVRMSEPDYFVNNPPALVKPVIQTIEGYWQQMRTFIDQVIKRDEKDVNITLMLRAKQRLLDEVSNLVEIID